MSLGKNSSEQNHQKETEIQEDGELHPEDCNGNDVQVKDFLKTREPERRSVSPLTFLKEDFSHLKEEVLKVFKDKDPAPKTSQPPEKLINPLTLFKEDFNHFKEDISSVFKIGLSKEPEDTKLAAKEDSSSAFKLKAPKPERTNEPIMGLFRRDRTLSKMNQKAKDVQEVRKALSEKTEEQMEHGFRKKSSINTEEANNNMKERLNESEDSKLDLNVSEEKNERRKGLSEPQQSQEVICTSETAQPHTFKDVFSSADQRCESDERQDDSFVVLGEEEEDDEPSETLRCPLSSEITLLSLRSTNNDLRYGPGEELWSLKNFAYYLTLDPNTANSELLLTESNRKATRVWSDHRSLDHRSSDHPERFEQCPQVLCREGLLDSVYWEVEWSGGADIGVTYNSIPRDGDMASCLLGHNEQSWSLECSEGSYTPCHNRKRFKSSSPEPFTRRVGVFLNWPAGFMSFYCVSSDTMVHLHTFTSIFTEPLYPGFWVWAYDGSVSLCQVELGWERLLQ